MPLDSRVRRFLDLLAASNPQSMRDASVEERRAGLVSLMRFAGAPARIETVADRTIPGAAGPLGARLYVPLGAPPDAGPGIVYFHGGGLVAGSVATHDPVARLLAAAAGCRVLSVDYRLAPEHPFPAGLDDALAAMVHLAGRSAEFGIDAGRLAICGDSAGATLVAAACQALVAAQGPVPALQILLCPILDYSRRSRSRLDFAQGYLVDEEVLAHDLRLYAPPGTDPADRRISPLRAADLAGQPPTIIHTAEFDPLRDEGLEYFERLSHAGCAVSYTCHPGMIHLFYGLGSVIPYARTAFEQLGGQVRTALV
jgi:acetyl esterase/lipase